MGLGRARRHAHDIDRADAEEAILQAVMDRIGLRMADGVEPLGEVQALQRGERRAGNPQMPALWVTPRAVNAESHTMASQTLTMDVMVWAELADKDPVSGAMRARKLSAVAAQQLLVDEGGNFDPEAMKLGLPYVVDNAFLQANGGATKAQNVYTYFTTNRFRFKVNL